MSANRPTLDDVTVYPLERVAEITGLAHRYILTECRAGRLRHIHRGNLRGMTCEHIAELLACNTIGGDDAQEPDELEQARAASRQSGARRKGRAA